MNARPACWDAMSSYLPHLFVLVALALVFQIWITYRCRSLVKRWAAENAFEILESQRRFFSQGPYFLNFLKRYRNQNIFFVKVRDHEGVELAAWICCHYWSGRVEYQWDVGQKVPIPWVRFAVGLTIAVGCFAVLAVMGPKQKHDSVQRDATEEATGPEEDAERARTFAAIAYSPSTGKYGYADEGLTRASVEAEARRRCAADDSRIVAWVHDGYCALAVGADGAYGVGWSHGRDASDSAAKERALEGCRKRSDVARLRLCVCSFGRKAEVID